jgi:hypothetical protein
MISRRTFLQDMAFVSLAPAIGNLLLVSSTPQSSAAVSPAPLHPQLAVGNAIFKIHGWDQLCDNESKENQVWLSINGSWRTGWR